MDIATRPHGPSGAADVTPAPAGVGASDLRNVNTHLDTSKTASDFAPFRDAGAPSNALSMGCETRDGALSQIGNPVQTLFKDAKWATIPALESPVRAFGRAPRPFSR